MINYSPTAHHTFVSLSYPTFSSTSMKYSLFLRVVVFTLLTVSDHFGTGFSNSVPNPHSYQLSCHGNHCEMWGKKRTTRLCRVGCQNPLFWAHPLGALVYLKLHNKCFCRMVSLSLSMYFTTTRVVYNKCI